MSRNVVTIFKLRIYLIPPKLRTCIALHAHPYTPSHHTGWLGKKILYICSNICNYNFSLPDIHSNICYPVCYLIRTSQAKQIKRYFVEIRLIRQGKQLVILLRFITKLKDNLCNPHTIVTDTLWTGC